VLQVIQMTNAELDTAVAERRKAAAQRQAELQREEVAAMETKTELEVMARERWRELEKELEAAAVDPTQPAPRFSRTDTNTKAGGAAS
jgi:hypothetical protein